MKITAERLRYLLDYDPWTGVFTWKRPTSNRVKVGSVANTRDGKGYIVIGVDGHHHRAHRLAFLYMTGRPPEGDIDHANRKRTDNKWANLREATRKENLRNKTGVRGTQLLRSGKWRARIQVDGRSVHIGCFSTEELARIAYRAAALKHFGEFAATE